ncbi:MAG: hypothetical protein BroJett039_06980 [Chloroflexota bacterium]|nr:MAG: hypothetical protein BroJett039_06980 [Chloroflexota bacterium]
MLTRRAFLQFTALAGLALLAPAHANADALNWRDLLICYRNGALNNYWEKNGRRALKASRLYPGIYLRDALWGTLGLQDMDYLRDCYQWFADAQLESGQIRSAVALEPESTGELESHDDESTLLFILASDRLRDVRRKVETSQVERAYAFAQTHVIDDLYISPSGAFRYWVDTLLLERADALAYVQGMFCLARRAMVNLGSGAVNEGHVAAAQRAYRSFFDATRGYVMCGKFSRFAFAQDVSAVFPEFLSRYLYNERILDDEMLVRHANRILANGSVRLRDGTLLGIKNLSTMNGAFFSPTWFAVPRLNLPGVYQNGGHWPLYSIALLALTYSITRDARYARWIGEMVTNELAQTQQSQEFISLAPNALGAFDSARADYSWNALIPVALQWCGLA